jgi:peptidoglycan/xylan/chitin deacetylase (PgdA/CDA1 family)
MISRGKVPAYSLFYHRISDDHPNPWSMTRDQFRRQIDWFQEKFDLVSLAELQRRVNSEFNDRPTLAITFDDGYAENCEYALPLLVERKIPVCYFVTIDNVVNQTPFPHDVGIGQDLPVNTIESLSVLSDSGIEIGAHTRTHMDLGSVSDQELLADEVIQASIDIEEIIGKPVQYFAFPFGQRENLNRGVFSMLKEHGFLGVCSAYGGCNEIGSDSFHIQRIHGDPSFERVKNWLSYDPRVTRVKPYKYDRRAARRDGQADPTKIHELTLPPINAPAMDSSQIAGE